MVIQEYWEFSFLSSWLVHYFFIGDCHSSCKTHDLRRISFPGQTISFHVNLFPLEKMFPCFIASLTGFTVACSRNLAVYHAELTLAANNAELTKCTVWNVVWNGNLHRQRKHCWKFPLWQDDIVKYSFCVAIRNTKN